MPATATPRGAVRTRSRRWEAHTDKRPRPDEERNGAGRRHTLRSRLRTHRRRWEARTGKCPHMERERWWPPPHHAEPYSDSPATVGGVHRQPPHLAEPFPDSPATVGGVHRQVLTLRRWGWVPAAATPRGAVPGLARAGGRRAPASDEGGVPATATPRGAFRSHPQRWETEREKRNEGHL
jgi:hypothetical protein